MSGVPAQSRCLTLTELVFNYGLYGGIGYVAAGQVGLWCGLGLITSLYGRLIWLSLPSAGSVPPQGGVLGEPGAEPHAAVDRPRE